MMWSDNDNSWMRLLMWLWIITAIAMVVIAIRSFQLLN